MSICDILQSLLCLGFIYLFYQWFKMLLIIVKSINENSRNSKTK